MKKKLHIYCRVSSEIQLRGYSLDAQKLEGIKKAKQLGYTPVFYEERGKSAADDTTLNRPELTRLLSEIEKGAVTDIFCSELDRFTRRVELLIEVERMFVKNNVVIHTCSATLNLNDSDQRFVAFLNSLLGERENKLKTERSIRGMQQAVEKGVWLGVMVPYGYKTENKILVIDDDEAKIYREIVDMCLGGMGTSAIAIKLNEMGVLTRGRKVLKNGTHTVNKHTQEKRHIPNKEILWAAGTVYSILTNPIGMGKRRWKGGFIDAPAIIDKDTFDKVQLALKTRRNYTNKKNQHKYLLKGFLRCGVCGSNLYGRIKPTERYYMCSSKRKHSCGLRSPNLDRIEKLVIDQVLNSHVHLAHVLSSITAVRSEESSDKAIQLATLEKTKSDMQVRINRLVNLYELGRIDLKTFDERKEIHDQKMLDTCAQIEQINQANQIHNRNIKAAIKHNNTIKSMRRKINKLSFEEKRSIIEQIIDNIIVKWDEEKMTHFIKIEFRIADVSYVAYSSTTPAHLPNPYSITKLACVENGKLIEC